MSILRFTAADRDEQGRIRVNAPADRSLADLLPHAEDEARPRALRRSDLAGVAAGLVLAGVLIAALQTWMAPSAAPPAAAQPTAPASVPTAAPAAPTAAPAAPSAPTLPQHAAASFDLEGQHGATVAGLTYTPVRALGGRVLLVVDGGGLVWVDRAAIDGDARVAALAAPTIAPVVIHEAAPPPVVAQCYEVTIDVLDRRGYPLGVATGRSCESRDAAQANAAAQAEELRTSGAAPSPPPTALPRPQQEVR